MAYEVKPGEGSLFPNKHAGGNAKAPGYKGYFVLPNGEVIGVALWKVDTKGGVILSLKVDDREGEYQARQLGRTQMRATADERVQNSRQSSGGSRHQRQEQQFDPDLDDEIPF